MRKSDLLAIVTSVLLAACSDDARDLGSADVPRAQPDVGVETDAGFDDRPDSGIDGGSLCGAAVTGQPEVVATNRGAVRGRVSGGALVFLGIPYAAPPIGPRRWAAPASPDCFDAIFEASSFGARCPQVNDDGVAIGEEDCLTLNVWTPQDAPGNRQRPVLFFIHGGGNAQGSSQQGVGEQILYDGRRLTEAHDVVVVTINYRLGALGYLVHSELEDGDAPSGNYGILDQIQALEWVQDNISEFGGDPTRVMIFGESAGARNTCILVASPLASGLFSGALMQSGGCSARTRDDVLATSRTQIAASGCSGAAGGEIACLRQRTARELIADNPPVVVVGARNENPGPHIDGRVIPAQPHERIQAGEHNDVPFVVGSNADETSRSMPAVATREAFEDQVRARFGDFLSASILSAYNVDDYPSPRAALIAVTTDAQFTCTARANARDAAMGQTQPVFRYFWTQGLDASPRLSAFGAFHAVELFFVFDNLRLAGYQPTDGEVALAGSVGRYWTRLASQGDPNSDGETLWPTYEPTNDPVLVLDAEGIQPRNGIRTAQCDMWDRLTGR